MRRFMPETTISRCRLDITRISAANSNASPADIIYFAGHEGVRIVGERRGPPDAPVVLLLHGGGQTRHAWAGAAERLARAGFCAIALDCRGHGDSDWSPNGNYSVDAMIADLRRVITQVGGTPVLVGASMGGITAMIAVGEGHIPAASKLVLVDIAPRVERAGVQRIIAFMSASPDGFATLEEVRDAVAAYNPHRPPSADLNGLKKNLRQCADGRYRWHWDPCFLKEAEATHHESGKALTELDRRLAAARNVRIPTLLVRGGGSDVVSPEGVRELRELIPHAQAVDIVGAGHMVAGDRNDVFTDAVLGFLIPHRY